MKRIIKKEDLTQEVLADLICTATYGSQWLDCLMPMEAMANIGVSEDDSREDIMAKALLAGEAIEAVDYTAEGEIYGNNGTGAVCDDAENAHYNLRLDDFAKGLQAALDGTFKANDEGEKEWANSCVQALFDDDDCCDLAEAEGLMQIIMFNEFIYG